MRSIREVSRSTGTEKIDRFCELDSHADTCCAGRNCKLIAETNLTVSVAPYSNKYKPIQNVPIVTAATAYDMPDSDVTYILIMNQALWFGSKLDDTLLCPNQIRANGNKVDDTPRQFSDVSDHSIKCPSEDGDSVTIQLQLNGVISRFATRVPTDEELEQCPRITLTGESPWNPYSEDFAETEELYIRNKRQIGAVMSESDGRHERATAPDIEETCHRVRENLLRYISGMSMSSIETNLEEQVVHGRTGESSLNPLYDRIVSTLHVLQGRATDETEMDLYDADRFAFAMSSGDKGHRVTPATLAKRWGIGLKAAEDTLTATTQAGVVNVVAPGDRRSTRRLNFLRYPRMRIKVFMDSMFAKVKSIRQYVSAQVYTNGKGYDHFFPMKSHKGENIAATLDGFVAKTGVPEVLVSDGAKEEILGEVEKRSRYYRIRQLVTEPYSPWQDKAEGAIREIKKAIRFHSVRTRSPRRLWCFLGEWVSAIRRFTARDSLDGRTAHEDVLGETPDISQYMLFDWYQVVWCLQPMNKFPYNKRVLGRWIGIVDDSNEIGTHRILLETGFWVSRKEVWELTDADKNNLQLQTDIMQLDAGIRDRLGDSIKDKDMDPEIAGQLEHVPVELFDDDELESPDEPYDESRTAREADEYTPEELDEYLTAQVALPRGDGLEKGTVKARAKNDDGVAYGRRNDNPILDTRVYDVEFPDGSTQSYAANVIAENILSQTDVEGRSYSILDEIQNHRTDGHAVKKDDGYLTDKRGRKSKRMTTKGWFLQVLWKDRSTSWVPLKDLKESNPVQVAEYAVANKLVEEPAFNWWVPFVMRKRDRIISKIKSKYWTKTHKFGLELPKTVEQALAIDKKTGLSLWRDAIAKEMKNNSVAFEILEDGVDELVGYKWIPCHMVFDIKMDLTRKARYVAGGHKTDPPKESVYSSVVSRDSVRIALTLAALNDLNVMAADIQNAYLSAPTLEKVYTTAGPEFGPDAGKRVKIVRALYGLRSSGKSFRDMCARVLRDAGFQSCLADPDVYMRKAVKSKTGEPYWEYVLMYVDDYLGISEFPEKITRMLQESFVLKPESIKEPDAYLGAEVRKYFLEGDESPEKVRWAMSSDKYVSRAVTEVEHELGLVGKMLQKRVETPLSSGYRPEMDLSPELDARRLNYYQGLIGVLRWICELGRIDIMYATSVMSSHMAMPREGHLDQVFHIFAYLKRFGRSSMVFNDIMPEFNEALFRQADWKGDYPDATEPLPPNAPEARGQYVNLTCFVDADHAGCRATRRSHTGFIIFINKAPIMFFSKRQNTVESSSFGSEFVALRQATDAIEGLRYKLRMLGVAIDGPTNVFCDNESVVKNSTAPESTLKKKHNAICYHRCREAQAAGIIRIAHHNGKTNIADMLTKNVPGPTLRYLVSRVLF